MLAGRQHGVVARGQLISLGLGEDAIDHRLTRGLLHRLHRGVYAVGHTALPRLSGVMAGALAIGPDAVVSHRDGAALYGVRRNSRSRIEVTVLRAVRSRPGVEVHHAVLQQDEITEMDGIPVTTVPRTLLDLAAVVDRRQLERAIHESEVRRLWDSLSLRDLLDRYPRRPGTPIIRAILADLDLGLNLIRNQFEALFLALVQEEGLRVPR